jgi:hypothetical protein
MFSCSAISGGIVDRSIEAEDRKHGDIMRLVSFTSSSETLFTA